MNVDTGRPLWVRDWAERIQEHQLSFAAMPLLELARAFGVLAGQALLAVRPMLTGIVADATLEQGAALLEHPELLDLLEAHLAEESG